MNVLFVSIDSLSRHFLNVYEPSIDDLDVETDNLDQFAERAAVFDTHYAGSLPCMPARREWLTGTQEFLWRYWGPVEPYDTTLPAAARREGVVTQLITDHYHYFQHGSGGYYEDFNGFEFVRGHEADAWRTSPRDQASHVLAQTTDNHEDPRSVKYANRQQYARNVADFDELAEEDFFAPKVFSKTADWLRANEDWEQWFCYVDSFDVHEPFHCPEPYASMYTDEDPRDPDLSVWPYYGPTDEGQSQLTDRETEFVRAQFAGKVTMVDRWFGRVLDALDQRNLWDDTMVIVTADHGHFLGEHGWMGKPYGAPMYNVLAHTPLFVWHPESDAMGGQIDVLTSAVDIYATILQALDLEVSDDTHSQSLLPLLTGKADNHRDWALYGYWGSTVNVTDGEYTYLHPCDESIDAAYHSTTMLGPYGQFKPPEPQTDAETGTFLPYTDCPVWRYYGPSNARHETPMLFDVDNDPWQRTNIANREDEQQTRMRNLLVDALDTLEAPDNQYERLGLTKQDR